MISIYISCVVCFTHAFLQVENSCFPSDPVHPQHIITPRGCRSHFLSNFLEIQSLLSLKSFFMFIMRCVLHSAMPGSRQQQQRCQRAETMFDCKKKLLLQNASTPDCLNRVHSTVRLLAELVEKQFRFSPNSAFS